MSSSSPSKRQRPNPDEPAPASPATAIASPTSLALALSPDASRDLVERLQAGLPPSPFPALTNVLLGLLNGQPVVLLEDCELPTKEYLKEFGRVAPDLIAKYATRAGCLAPREVRDATLKLSRAAKSGAPFAELQPLLCAALAAACAAPGSCSEACAAPRHTRDCRFDLTFQDLFKCAFLLSGRITANMALYQLQSLLEDLKEFERGFKPSPGDIEAVRKLDELDELDDGPDSAPLTYTPPSMKALIDAIDDVVQLLPYSEERETALWNRGRDDVERRLLPAPERLLYRLLERVRVREELVIEACVPWPRVSPRVSVRVSPRVSPRVSGPASEPAREPPREPATRRE